jgi:VWFA-related protein
MSMIGKTPGHYEITSRLGKGSMGEVYQAKDQKLRRDVGIKVPRKSSRTWILLSSVLIFISDLLVHSQEPLREMQLTYSVKVEVVNVLVTVRNKNGKLIRDLKKDDFSITEDGRPQTIQYFTSEAGLPLSLGLIVDTTPSESKILGEEKEASRIFFFEMLRPDKDKAFLIQFGENVELLQPLSLSIAKPGKALDRLKPHPNGILFSGSPLETSLADSIIFASDKIMKLQEGRKALVLLCDGFHVGSHKNMAIESAQKADVLIYPIRIYDKNYQARYEWKQNLIDLSGSTGGSYFELNKMKELSEIYRKIQEELRNQYNIGYTPDSDTNKGYRKITVEVRDRGMIARNRDGYYPNPSPK